MQCARPGPFGLPKLVLRLGTQLERGRREPAESPDTVWIIGLDRRSSLSPDLAGGTHRADRVKTVSKLGALEHLGLALSEKQIPQIVENSKKCGELLEPLEGDGMRPRQVRYQAALRPDFLPT
jgi:hypothetical protein